MKDLPHLGVIFRVGGVPQASAIEAVEAGDGQGDGVQGVQVLVKRPVLGLRGFDLFGGASDQYPEQGDLIFKLALDRLRKVIKVGAVEGAGVEAVFEVITVAIRCAALGLWVVVSGAASVWD